MAPYDPTALTGGVSYRWASGSVVRVWVVNGLTVTNDLQAAARQAYVRWNDVRQFAEFTLVAASRIEEANIVIFDREVTSPVLPGDCTFDARGSAGYTYFCPDAATPPHAERLPLASGARAAVSVIIRVDRGRVSSAAAYYAVVAHELGHALGIGAHSDAATDVMFGFPTVDVPTARDAAMLRAVLGRKPDLTL